MPTPIDFIEELPEICPPPSIGDYVAYDEECHPYGGLLMAEAYKIATKTRMTQRQRWCWLWHLSGCDHTEIARYLDVDESTVRQHVEAAYDKADTFQGRGLLTVGVEQIGWKGVRAVLAERQDLSNPFHPKARESRVLERENREREAKGLPRLETLGVDPHEGEMPVKMISRSRKSR